MDRFRWIRRAAQAPPVSEADTGTPPVPLVVAFLAMGVVLLPR